MENNSTHIIFGAGAVGIYLAGDLLEKNKENFVILVNRSAILSPLKILSSQEMSKQISNKIINQYDDYIRLIREKKYETLYIYICLPPNQVGFSLKALSHLINCCDPSLTININFLNNGLIHNDLIEKIENFLIKRKITNYTFIRSSVIIGVRRQATEDFLEVHHSNGNSIEYGLLRNSKGNPVKIDYSKFFSKINWVPHKNIRQAEIAKFFTNIILGLYIGKREIPNKYLKEILPMEELVNIEVWFSQLFYIDDSKYLSDYLWKTVENTKDNVNSVSLTWLSGDSSIIDYFLQEIENKLKIEKKEKLSNFYLKNILPLAKKAWK